MAKNVKQQKEIFSRPLQLETKQTIDMELWKRHLSHSTPIVTVKSTK